MLFASLAEDVLVFDASAAALSVPVPSVLAGSAVAGASVALEDSLAPDVVSSAPAGLAGAGSPGLTVSITAGELDDLVAYLASLRGKS